MPPSNHFPLNKQCKIIIKNTDGVEQYTHEMPDIKCLHPILAVDCQGRMIDGMGNYTITKIAGTEAYGTGKYKQAGSFDNSTYYTIPDEDSLDFDIDDEFSISAWVKFNDIGTAGVILGKNSSVGFFTGWALYRDSTDNKIYFHIKPSTSSNAEIKSTTVTVADTWYHVVATKGTTANRTAMKLYVNGVLEATGTSLAMTGVSTNSDAVSIGAEDDGGIAHDGFIQHLFLHDFELTQAQVDDLYASQCPYGSVSKTTAAIETLPLLGHWKLNKGVNSAIGGFTFNFQDDAKAFLSATSAKESILERGWLLEVWLGKRPRDAYRAFKGVIQTATPHFPSTSRCSQRVYAMGEMTELANTHTFIRRYQEKKSSDADDIDLTDLTTYISQIAIDLIVDRDHLANKAHRVLPYTTHGIETIAISLPDFQKNFVTIGLALDELANIGNCYFGIDSDSDVWMHIKDTKTSQLLITNDTENTLLNAHDGANYSILINRPRFYEDSIVDGGYGIIHGLGYERTDSDDKQESANSALDLSAFTYSHGISPRKDNIIIFAPFLARAVGAGTITQPLVIEIRENDPATNKPATGVKARIEIAGALLEKELDATGKYFEVQLQKVPWIADSLYHAIYKKYPDATDRPDLDYQTGVGIYYTSTDGGATWGTFQTGDVKFREYASRSTRIVAENVEAAKKYRDREIPVPLNDYNHPIPIVAGLSESLGKERRKFPDMVISCPDNQLELGKKVRITDVFSGIDMTANLVGYTIEGNAYDAESNKGARHMTIKVEKHSYG